MYEYALYLVDTLVKNHTLLSASAQFPFTEHIIKQEIHLSDSWESVLWSLDRTNEPRFQGRQGPELGAWNYPDALFTGNGGMSNDEYRYCTSCAVRTLVVFPPQPTTDPE